MLKRDLFIAAMKARCYRRVPWIITAFSITREAPDAWKEDPYPYRLVNSPVGYYFVNPQDATQLLKVEDGVAGQALYRFKEKLTIGDGDCDNYVGEGAVDIVTSYGNLLYNWFAVVEAFGRKLPYMNPKEKVKTDKILDLIKPRLADDLPEGHSDKSIAQVAPIYIRELREFGNRQYDLTSLSQLCTYGATEKVLMGPPGAAELKKRLLEENKDKLDDLATIAKIGKELQEFDAAFLKGDEAENFLIDNKSRKTVRPKLWLMLGAEAGLDKNNVKAKLVERSLSEGWDVSKFADMNNVSRAGSFSRGHETQLGGVSVKWLQRASANLNITVDDCGSRLGVITEFTEDMVPRMVGFSIVTQEGHKLIKSEKEAGAYLGKRLMVRSPQYCIAEKTDYCRTCVGERLAINKDGLSIAVSDYGSVFMLLAMKAMHGKVVATAKMDFKRAIT